MKFIKTVQYTNQVGLIPYLTNQRRHWRLTFSVGFGERFRAVRLRLGALSLFSREKCFTETRKNLSFHFTFPANMNIDFKYARINWQISDRNGQETVGK